MLDNSTRDSGNDKTLMSNKQIGRGWTKLFHEMAGKSVISKLSLKDLKSEAVLIKLINHLL